MSWQPTLFAPPSSLPPLPELANLCVEVQTPLAGKSGLGEGSGQTVALEPHVVACLNWGPGLVCEGMPLSLNRRLRGSLWHVAMLIEFQPGWQSSLAARLRMMPQRTIRCALQPKGRHAPVSATPNSIRLVSPPDAKSGLWRGVSERGPCRTAQGDKQRNQPVYLGWG